MPLEQQFNPNQDASIPYSQEPITSNDNDGDIDKLSQPVSTVYSNPPLSSSQQEYFHSEQCVPSTYREYKYSEQSYPSPEQPCLTSSVNVSQKQERVPTRNLYMHSQDHPFSSPCLNPQQQRWSPSMSQSLGSQNQAGRWNPPQHSDFQPSFLNYLFISNLILPWLKIPYSSTPIFFLLPTSSSTGFIRYFFFLKRK